MKTQFVFGFIAALFPCAIGVALCMAQTGQPFYKGRKSAPLPCATDSCKW